MIKLSESRLREIIVEELEAVHADAELIDSEKAERIASLNAEIDKKMGELEALVAENGLDENTLFDMGSSIFSTAQSLGSLGGSVAGRISKSSNITKAIQQYAKESLIRWVFGKIGIKDGKLKDLFISFFEELEFNEIRMFISNPQCSMFVEQMFDTLLDFGLDSLRPTLDSATNKVNSIPLLKIIMRSSPGNDIMTKLLSGVGTEAIQNFIRTDPTSKEWIEKNVLVGVCNVWDKTWGNIDIEDGLIDLNAALDKAYPDEFSSGDSLI